MGHVLVHVWPQGDAQAPLNHRLSTQIIIPTAQYFMCFHTHTQDDKKLRAAWRVLYNDSELAGIKAQVDACAAHDIEFMFALSPGLDMCHSSEAEHNTLKAKLDQIADLGVRNFAILFDDISEELGSQDAQAFTSQVRQHRGLAGRWKLVV